MKLPSIFISAMTVLYCLMPLYGQGKEIVWSDQEKPIHDEIRKLRSLPDDARTKTTRDLALQIQALPTGPNRLNLALALAMLSTEGDFGHDTLQEVASTLATSIGPAPPEGEDPYLELASLVRYEHLNVTLDSPQFSAAISKLEAEDRNRQSANFALTDLNGQSWTLKDLKGKVVLLNFWATWCPPCRKEMPDLETLYRRFQSEGLVFSVSTTRTPVRCGHSSSSRESAIRSCSIQAAK